MEVAPEPETINTLLIEDNEGDAILIKNLLKDSILQTAWVTSLAEAKRYLESHSIDVILLDLGLFESSGLETLSEAQSFIDGIPVIVLTGLDCMEMATKAIEMGVQDWIIKGVTDEFLKIDIIFSVVRHRTQALKAKDLAVHICKTFGYQIPKRCCGAACSPDSKECL